jgi:hypothetical protein
MKTKIRAIMPRPPRERRSSPRLSPRTALTRTARHWINGIGQPAPNAALKAAVAFGIPPVV